ncbi:N-6 DNA methylase [Fulvivirgaceae bacterium BMA10]|uniref:N-6 DNA methylase n=1 Tax=Splendidivirga corallicola TaxID=3051826 RepID=A0ABT8KKD6_9BACT|nr:N-6 DNA methylase [Fulvivirgaceae bacterium BMA10]
MTVEVTYNQEKERDELLFSEELSKETETFLKEKIGLNQHFRNPKKWLGVNHPSYRTYIKELKSALLKEKPIESVELQPSFSPSEENIDNNKFSYVTISYNKDGTTEYDNYVVFDSYKKVAGYVAESFGKQKFGSAYKGASIYPRNYKRKARTLLKEGKVIAPKKDAPLEEIKEAGKNVDPKDLSKAAIPHGKSDYLDKVIAHMHDEYATGKRVTKGQIEKLAKELEIPNMGIMWEMVELSWMLWYRNLYRDPKPFENRLDKMIHFWHNVQPTYAYSDSSKEIYKQYSTPCPISAIIAQYTDMDNATKIFEPSAGNGLLLVGAVPSKTHANEIDKTRLKSLEFVGFDTITSYNATEPFPEKLDKTFDVVVTNPPFAKWEEDKYDKEFIVGRYFNNQRGLVRHMRLEHVMSGLALHTMKDQGRAALLIMGHQLFDEKDGLLGRYRPFFNWLFRHYHVNDVINMNSFKLYNKQGAVERTMLVLISGRKKKPKGASPTQKEAAHFQDIVNSFRELWERVKPHVKGELDTVINQLKTELRQ